MSENIFAQCELFIQSTGRLLFTIDGEIGALYTFSHEKSIVLHTYISAIDTSHPIGSDDDRV